MISELKFAFKRPQIYIGLLGMFICLLSSSLPIWLTRVAQGDKEFMSAMDLSFTPIFFGGTILLMPFCAAISYASTQADEIKTGFIFPRIIRGSLNRYAVTKIFVAALSGAFALGTACLLHMVFWHIVAGPYDIQARPEIEVFFTDGTIYSTLCSYPYAWPAFAHAIAGFALTGAFWSVVSLWIASIIPDTQLVVTIPVVVYYLWKSNFTGYAFGFELPDFTGFYNDGVTWLQYGYALGFHALLFILIVWLYHKSLKRRSCYA